MFVPSRAGLERIAGAFWICARLTSPIIREGSIGVQVPFPLLNLPQILCQPSMWVCLRIGVLACPRNLLQLSTGKQIFSPWICCFFSPFHHVLPAFSKVPLIFCPTHFSHIFPSVFFSHIFFPHFSQCFCPHCYLGGSGSSARRLAMPKSSRASSRSSLRPATCACWNRSRSSATSSSVAWTVWKRQALSCNFKGWLDG